MPLGAPSFTECLRMGAEVFHALKKTLHDRGLGGGGGRRGRLRARTSAPTRRRCRCWSRASRPPATRPGDDVAIALDPAVSEIFSDGAYVLEHEGRTLSAAELADYWADLASRYPIVSLEDGMAEEDWDGWAALTERLGAHLQLVGDDLFVTNTERLRRGIDAGRGQLDPGQGQPDRHADRDAGRDRDGARGRLQRGHVAPLGRDRGRRRSPTSPWPPAAGRSRPARRRARTAWRSTTSSCASRSSSARTRASRDGRPSARDARVGLRARGHGRRTCARRRPRGASTSRSWSTASTPPTRPPRAPSSSR